MRARVHACVRSVCTFLCVRTRARVCMRSFVCAWLRIYHEVCTFFSRASAALSGCGFRGRKLWLQRARRSNCRPHHGTPLEQKTPGVPASLSSACSGRSRRRFRPALCALLPSGPLGCLFGSAHAHAPVASSRLTLYANVLTRTHANARADRRTYFPDLSRSVVPRRAFKGPRRPLSRQTQL